jgi:hypothetical protein
MTMRATVSLDDGWVRVYLAGRLEREAFDALQSALGLSWKRAEACLAGPWTPQIEDTLRQQYGVTIEEENVDLRQVAADRAAHYVAWADSAAERFEAEHAAERAILDRIPMGQPIQVGHHSEGRHRRDLARADGHARRAYDEMQRHDKWAGRAEDTVRHAERRYTAEQLTARIGLLEVARRRHGRREAEHRERLTINPFDRAAGNDVDSNRRMAAFLDRRIAYARQLLEEAETAAAGDVGHGDVGHGDVARSVAARRALAIEAGGAVSEDAPGAPAVFWYQVVRVNAQTVTVCGWPHVPQMTHKLKRDRIKQTMPAADWAAADKAVYGPAMRIVGGTEEG